MTLREAVALQVREKVRLFRAERSCGSSGQSEAVTLRGKAKLWLFGADGSCGCSGQSEVVALQGRAKLWLFRTEQSCGSSGQSKAVVLQAGKFSKRTHPTMCIKVLRLVFDKLWLNDRIFTLLPWY